MRCGSSANEYGRRRQRRIACDLHPQVDVVVRAPPGKQEGAGSLCPLDADARFVLKIEKNKKQAPCRHVLPFTAPLQAMSKRRRAPVPIDRPVRVPFRVEATSKMPRTGAPRSQHPPMRLRTARGDAIQPSQGLNRTLRRRPTTTPRSSSSPRFVYFLFPRNVRTSNFFSRESRTPRSPHSRGSRRPIR